MRNGFSWTPKVKTLISLAAGIALLTFAVVYTVFFYKTLTFPKKIFIGTNIIGLSVLVILYLIKYFTNDLDIPFLLVAALIGWPALLYMLLEKRRAK